VLSLFAKLASPYWHIYQRSPATSAFSPDGSHLYPVEVQSSFGKYISHQSMARDTGSRARYVFGKPSWHAMA
jgi:hypothetical protein